MIPFAIDNVSHKLADILNALLAHASGCHLIARRPTPRLPPGATAAKPSEPPPLGIREDEGFGVRMVGVRRYTKNVSLARLASHRDFGTTFERLASEGISSGQLGRPDIILASLPPLESPEAARRLAHKLDATFILDMMDLWPETFERLLPGPPFLRRILAPLFLGKMGSRRQALVADADALASATHTYAATAFADAPTETPKACVPARRVCR